MILHRLCLWQYLFTVFTRVFGDGALVDDRFIESPAACQVIAIVAIACQYSVSKVGTKSRMAMNIDGFVFRDFVKSLTQGVKRNVNKAVNFTIHYFIRCTGVEQENTAVTGKAFHVVPEELLEFSADDIFGNEAEHIDGVFRTAEGRRIAQFKGGKVGDLCTKTGGGGKHVHTLVHAVEADDLRADDLERFLIPQRFY